MATKTISIDMEACRILRRERKGPRDSYFQVIQRLYAAHPVRTVDEFLKDHVPALEGRGFGGPKRHEKILLLDTTFVSDLDAELTRSESGPAQGFFERMRPAEIFISVVTVAEFYEKRGREAARELASRFAVLRLHIGDALRCGQLQARAARRRGENDGWLTAQALRGGCAIVTRDLRFDDVPGLEVLRY
ncbi:MAG: PIN domain-containing protein [Opitutus sp.]|nr:PIN domain-containing protein [Opitutus sp.]